MNLMQQDENRPRDRPTTHRECCYKRAIPQEMRSNPNTDRLVNARLGDEEGGPPNEGKRVGQPNARRPKNNHIGTRPKSAKTTTSATRKFRSDQALSLVSRRLRSASRKVRSANEETHRPTKLKSARPNLDWAKKNEIEQQK